MNKKAEHLKPQNRKLSYGMEMIKRKRGIKWETELLIRERLRRRQVQ